MYTVKTKGDKKIIEGKYIPKGNTCKCKECSYSIEVPSITSDNQIVMLIEKIKSL